MFHNIPPAVQGQMERLEAIDARDRVDGTPHRQRLRQIPPETGKFLAILTASAPKGEIIEIGTSAGYSTLWLALACLPAGRMITTFEIQQEKATLAAETFHAARLEDEGEGAWASHSRQARGQDKEEAAPMVGHLPPCPFPAKPLIISR